MQYPAWGAGIDRLQRVRYIGSYADPYRYSSSAGWFEPNLRMAANEAVYYNFEAGREAALETDGADVVTIFDGDLCSGNVYVDATLPGQGGIDIDVARAEVTVEDGDDICAVGLQCGFASGLKIVVNGLVGGHPQVWLKPTGGRTVSVGVSVAADVADALEPIDACTPGGVLHDVSQPSWHVPV